VCLDTTGIPKEPAISFPRGWGHYREARERTGLRKEARTFAGPTEEIDPAKLVE
jgi:hypothetical protein